jgi:ligand-binding sensor domain-containing protein
MLAAQVMQFWSDKDGLGSNAVVEGLQDDSGFIWLATQGGLTRFDGVRFEVFNTQSRPRIKSNKINALALSSRNELWMGFDNGLQHIRLADYSVRSIDFSGKEQQSVEDIIFIGDTACVLSKSGHLHLYFDKDTDTTIYNSKRENGAFGERCRAVNYKGKLYIFSENEGCFEVIIYPQISVREIPLSDFSGNSICKLGNEGPAVFGAGGILKWDNKKEGFNLCSDYGMNVYAMHKDYKNDVWYVNKGRQQLNCYRTNDSSSVAFAFESAKNVHINALFEDNSHNIWICSSSGLYKITNSQARFRAMMGRNDTRVPNRIPSFRGIYEDTDGALYAGSYGGLYKISNGEPHPLLLDSLTFCPYSIIDDKEYLWIATEGKGMLHIHKQTGRQEYFLYPQSEMFHNKYKYFTCAIKLNDTSIWVGDYERLMRFNPVNKQYDFPLLTYLGKPLKNITVRQFLAARNGHIWLATLQGLIQLNNKGEVIAVFNTEHYKMALPEDAINSVFEDYGGNIWIGFMNVGIASFSPKKQLLSVYDVSAGLADNHTSFIIGDKSDNIWIGTFNGLSRLDSTRSLFANYYMKDGLAHNEFNHGSACLRHNGELVMGGVDGLSILPAENKEIKSENFSLRLARFETLQNIEDIAIQYVLNRGERIHLDYNHRYLKIYVAALDYKKPSKNSYFYRLKGMDAFWKKLGNQSEITFAALPFGDYELEIKATNAEGVTAGNILKIPLSVSQVFYKTGWFIFSGFLIIFLVIGYIVFQRIRQLRAIAQMRLSISSDLHDDVGSVLTRVAMEAELIQDELDEKYNQIIKEISNSCRLAMRNMRDAVWSIDTGNEKPGSFFDKIREFARLSFENSQFTYTLQITDDANQLIFTPIDKRELFLMIKEAISNILKHSSGDKVAIKAFIAEGTLIITIHDNGILQNIHEGTGSGLRNMQMRAARVKARYYTKADSGYTVIIEKPIKKSIWNL